MAARHGGPLKRAFQIANKATSASAPLQNSGKTGDSSNKWAQSKSLLYRCISAAIPQILAEPIGRRNDRERLPHGRTTDCQNAQPYPQAQNGPQAAIRTAPRGATWHSAVGPLGPPDSGAHDGPSHAPGGSAVQLAVAGGGTATWHSPRARPAALDGAAGGTTRNPGVWLAAAQLAEASSRRGNGGSQAGRTGGGLGMVGGRPWRRPLSAAAADAESGPMAVDYRSLLSEGDFHRLSDDVLHHLQERIEEVGEDLQVDGFDSDYSQGVLTMRLGTSGTYVINKQTPNRQIWLSSPVSGPARFDWISDRGVWVYRRNGRELVALLEEELSHLLESTITLR